MKPFTKKQCKQLIANGKSGQNALDTIPVAIVNIPAWEVSFMAVRFDDDEFQLPYGLLDFGKGAIFVGHYKWYDVICPKTKVRPHCAPGFIGKYPLSIYKAAAEHFGAITYDEELLNSFVEQLKK